jgi:hypothetical protein
MEALYVIIIIVAIFIAILTAAVIGNIVVRRNRKQQRQQRRQQRPRPRPRPPVIPGTIPDTIPDIITSNIPSIIPVTTPNTTISTANSVVAQVVNEPRVKKIDEINKYYVKGGNDPFIEIFNDELYDFVERTLKGSNDGYAEISFDYCINKIIEDTVDDREKYFGDDRKIYNGDDPGYALNSNPYERLSRIWNAQPNHSTYYRCIYKHYYMFYLELYTLKNGKHNYSSRVTIVYIPTVDNNNDGNILKYKVEYIKNIKYINTYYPTTINTQVSNIDDLDRMIQDMNTQMPYE